MHWEIGIDTLKNCKGRSMDRICRRGCGYDARCKARQARASEAVD